MAIQATLFSRFGSADHRRLLEFLAIHGRDPDLASELLLVLGIDSEAFLERAEQPEVDSGKIGSKDRINVRSHFL